MTPETKLNQSLVKSLRPAQVIAVASGKGGVGKTWFSITLAHALSRLNQRTLLFDGDLGLANVDIQLGLMPEKDLGNVLSGQSTLRQSTLSYSEGGFDIIVGRSGSGSLSSLPAKRLSALRKDLMALSLDYDQVIIDLGAGLENTVRSLTDSKGVTLVITTEEPTALTDAYAFIKVTLMEKPKSDIRVIVNMAGNENAGQKTYNTLLRACQNFLKVSPPLVGVIRRDQKIRDSIRNQTPLLTRYPNSPAASDVISIAGNLM